MRFRAAARLILLFGLLLLLTPGCQRRELPAGEDGFWSARRPGSGDQIRLDLEQSAASHGHRMRHRLWFDIDKIEGFGAEAFRGSGEPFSFTWERDAGTFYFNGEQRRRPRGTFRFEPSETFSVRLDALGIEGGPLISMAMRGVSIDLIEALAEAGYKVDDVDDFVRFESMGMDERWVQAAAQLPGPPSIRELINLARYGVDADEIDGWVAAGMQEVSIDDWLSLKIYDVELDEVVFYREQGIVALDDWISLHQYGVDRPLVAAAREAMPRQFDVSNLIQFSQYGFDAEWLRRLRIASEDLLSSDELIRLEQYGVDADLYEAFVSRGVRTGEAVRTLHMNGVEPEFLDRLKSAGISIDRVDRIVDAHRVGLDQFLDGDGS